MISRRETLLGLGGAAVYVSTGAAGNVQSPLRVGGVAVDLALSALSSTILRLSLVPALSAAAASKVLNDDPVLAFSSQGQPLVKGQSTESSREVKWGNRRLRITGSPLTIGVEDEDGKAIQSLRIDEQGTVSFKSSNGPVFGLGEGGPQFDRRPAVHDAQWPIRAFFG